MEIDTLEGWQFLEIREIYYIIIIYRPNYQYA
jgi:hypothetical protein